MIFQENIESNLLYAIPVHRYGLTMWHLAVSSSLKLTFVMMSLIFLSLNPSRVFSQTTFATKSAKIGFFSSTPIEDIKAVSLKGTAILITTNNELAFQIPIKTFEFEKGLMQEHFNENYMESDKYPVARFKGKLDQSIDFSKDGEYNVTATGTLLIHGVEKPRKINGKIRIANQAIQIASNFDVACADHRIKIPTLVLTKIAEVINVNVNASLTPLN